MDGQMQRHFSFYGTYTMCVYLMSIPGGIIADKFIGHVQAIMLRWDIIMFWHASSQLLMLMGGLFCRSLFLLLLGWVSSKPNISTAGWRSCTKKVINKRALPVLVFFTWVLILELFWELLTAGAVALLNMVRKAFMVLD